MAESVQTGGLVQFRYPSVNGIQKNRISEDEKKEISLAYEAYDKRKKKEKIEKIIIALIILLAIIISAYLFFSRYK